MSWSKTTDKETAQNGLTYNLRVGTTLGGSEIVSPMANVATGYRKIPQLGNTNHSTRWTIKNLPAGKYYWSVQAIDNAFAGSTFAGEQSFVIGGIDQTPPAAPQGLSAIAIAQQVTLKWRQNTETDFLRYRIYRGTSPNPTTKVDSTNSITDTTKTITGLSNGTKYYFRITAVDQNYNESSFSNEVSATPTAGNGSPAPPKNLTATAGDKQVTLKWDANTELNLQGYRIYGGTSPNPTTLIDSVPVGILGTSKTITGLANGTTYYFRITAVTLLLIESGYSNEVSAMPTAANLPPASPQNLRVAAGDRQITLTWNANTETDFLRYRIYSGTSPNPTTKVDSTNGISTTTKTLTGLTNGTKYYYRITAVDQSFNQSGFSNEVSATPTTGPAVPAAPTNLVATPVSSTQINLTWQDNAANENGFRIEHKIGDTGAYLQIATVGANVTSFSSATLSSNTKYYYRVRAYNVSGQSDYSNEANATTTAADMPPASPQNLRATAGVAQVTLTWNANTETDFLRYRIYGGTSANPTTKMDSVDGAANTNKNIANLSNGTTYYFRLTAIDKALQASGYSNAVSAIPSADKTPPTLGAVSYAQKVNLNTDAAVSLSITDLSGIKNATLYYRSGGAATFSNRAMTLQNGSTYKQTIPAAAVTNRGVEFYVTAEDGPGNISQSPSYPIQVYCPNGIANSNAQPSGKDASAYGIFSIPLDLDNKSPAAFLNANPSLGAYDDTKYRWYGFERSTQVLQEYPNFGSIEMTPDMGFALLVNISNVKLKTGSGTTAVTTVPYNFALSQGWSLIGNPFNYNIPFDSLRVSAGTFELWSFEGDWQINTRGLEPWKGYAIWLSQAATFSIRPSLAGLKSTSSFYSVDNNDAKNWLIQITAENGRSASRFNFAGQNEMAKDDEDQFDLHQPRFFNFIKAGRLADGVELVFNQQLTSDIRRSSTNGHTWELTCVLNPADEMLSLAFEGIQSIPSNFEVFLIDRETQTAYDLRRNQRLQFATRNLTEKRFQLIAGTKAYLNAQKLEAELHPSSYVLLQNFPNPFNPATQIIYSLPEASHVEVSVYNLRGERVATLVNGHQEAGAHSVVWNATEVGSGVYLIRIRAGRFESMKKCVFVK